MANYMNLAEDRIKTIELNYSQQNSTTSAPPTRSRDGLWHKMVNYLPSFGFGASDSNNTSTSNNNKTHSYAQANTLSRSAPSNTVPYSTNHFNASSLTRSEITADQSRVNNNNNNANVYNNTVNMN